MNHDMCYPFVPMIIVFLRSLLNYSIMTILLKVVLYRRLWLIIQVIVLSTSLTIMIWYFSMKLFLFWITTFWQMGDTWKLIGVLVPIVLTEYSSKDDCLPCSSTFLEGFNELFHRFDEIFHALSSIFLEYFDELFHWFDELFHALSSIFLEGFDEMLHRFDENPHAILLLLLKLDILKLNCFEKWQG